jgi:hypothetical protein
VTLHAVREVWVRVEIDGRQTLSRLLHAGEHFELEAGRDVSVRAGDGAALLVGVDGHPPAAMGQPGVALTRRFGVSRPQTRNPAGTHEAGLNEVRAPRAFQQTTSQPSPGSVPAQATGSLVATNVRPVDGPAVDEHDLLRAHLAYFEALERGDNAQMGRLCAEGFTVSGGPATDGSGLPYEISLNGASVEVRGVGAVVNGVASQRITGSDGQVSRTQPLRFSEVWVKRDGQWQLLNVRFIDAALR